MSSTDKLNPKQRAFVREFIKDKNATQAYMRAYGASQESADRSGPRLLGHVGVKSAIEAIESQQLAQVQHETGVTLERVVRELAKVALFDTRKFWREDGTLKPIHELDDDAAAALAGFEVTQVGGRDGDAPTYVSKIKISDRKPALDALMKHLGGYKQDNEQKGNPLRELLQAVGRSAFPVRE